MGGAAFLPERRDNGHHRQTAPARRAEDAAGELHTLSFLLLECALTPNTRKSYSRSIKKWFTMRIARGAPLFFSRDDTPDRMETALVEFYTFYAVKCNYSVSSMNTFLYSIRSYHQARGVDLRFSTMARLAGVRKGWQRISGAGIRKIAVSGEMLIEAIAHGGLDLDVWDDCLTAVALSFN